jgi:hypothetical protein
MLFGVAGTADGPLLDELWKATKDQSKTLQIDGVVYNELPKDTDVNPVLTAGEKSGSLFAYSGKLQMLKLYEKPEGNAVRFVMVTPFIERKRGLFFTSLIEGTNSVTGDFHQEEKHFFSQDAFQVMHVTFDGQVTESSTKPKLLTVGMIKDTGVIIWHQGNVVTKGFSNSFRYFKLEQGRGTQGAQVLRPVISK